MRKLQADLKRFTDEFPLAGVWDVSYHDETHLPPVSQDKDTIRQGRLARAIKLGSILIDDADPDAVEGSIVPFTFALESQQSLREQLDELWREEEKGKPSEKNLAKYPARIYGEMSESLIRTRICPPKISRRDWEILSKEKKALIFITDTNTIRRGVISSLADTFESIPIWTIVPVVSMLELQEASGRVKWDPSEVAEAKNFDRYLGWRPMSTSSTRELLMLKSRVPVEFLEVPPELLRYYGGKEYGEAKTPKILQDRLVLEGIKQIIREKSTAEKIYLLSGDFDMVRFAKLENVEAIYADKYQLDKQGQEFYSARYNIYKKGFVACGAHEFLWDIAHVFSFIKINSTQFEKTVTLEYYFQGKNVRDWEVDILEVTELGDEQQTE